jgi:hypothetical protein
VLSSKKFILPKAAVYCLLYIFSFRQSKNGFVQILFIYSISMISGSKFITAKGNVTFFFLQCTIYHLKLYCLSASVELLISF